MKKIVLFICLFIVGVVIGFVGYRVQHQRTTFDLVTMLPQNTTDSRKTNFSIEHAPSQSLRGFITELDGDVWWESRSSSEPAEVSDSVIFQQGETVFASDSGTIAIRFDPATRISLIPKTTIDIVQTLPTSLVFTQWKGSAIYETADPASVSVRSLRLLTNIKQGKVKIDVDEETHQIHVDVLEGIATVAYNDTDIVSQIKTIKTGQTFSFDSDERKEIIE